MVVTRARAAALEKGASSGSSSETDTTSGSGSSSSDESSGSSVHMNFRSKRAGKAADGEQQRGRDGADENGEERLLFGSTGERGDEGTAPEPERLGRGCRIRRVTRTLEDDYLAQLVAPAVSRLGRKSGRHRSRRDSSSESSSSFQLVLQQRYPEREAARKAIQRMSCMDSDTDESDSTDGNEKQSLAAVSSSMKVAGGALSHTSGKAQGRGGYRGGVLSTHASSRKRTRGASNDSSISIESLRERGDGKSGDEAGDQFGKRILEEGASDSSGSSAPHLDSQEEGRAFRNAQDSTKRNISINHFMSDILESGNPRARGAGGDKRKRRSFEGIAPHSPLFSGKSYSGGAPGLFDLGENSSPRGTGDDESRTADISPLKVDPQISFDSVGGLPQHIVALREMVLLPLLYPELMKSLHVTPPRGVLFVGPPGTGKTLMARALASEGMRAANQKITFFMRKGADVLSKWVGESERQLSMLFEEAKRHQPSIIFFDEIDGLAPTRHAKVEHTQAALVSTFLALMDGLDDRGNVVVIGATNRPDTIDPALRRPGRFDRELRFPLPDAAARRHILRIQTEKLLPQDHHTATAALLDELVKRSEGWSGADIKALCTEAGMIRLRSTLPQLYTTSQRLCIPKSCELRLCEEDFFVSAHRLQPTMARVLHPPCFVASLDEHSECLLGSTRKEMLQLLGTEWFPVKSALRLQERDCSDLHEAAIEMCSVVIPATGRALFLSLEESAGGSHAAARLPGNSNRCGAASLLTAKAAAAVLVKALPSFTHRSIHLLPQTADPAAYGGYSAALDGDRDREGGGAPDWMGAAANDNFVGSFGGQLLAFLQSLRSATPAVVTLVGLDEWLGYSYPRTWLAPERRGSTAVQMTPDGNAAGLESTPAFAAGEEACPDADCDEELTRIQQIQAFRYHVSQLAFENILFVVPTESSAVVDLLLGRSGVMAQDNEAEADPQWGASVPIRAVSLRVEPMRSPLDLIAFFSYVHRVVHVTLAAASTGEWAELPVDVSPPPPPLPQPAAVKEAIARQWELWRRVDYRRRQLRHILTKWVSQYLSSKKFSVLFSADLDFQADTPMLAAWQAHTADRRIGLYDIMEKLEAEAYTCLSQYHWDIDMLVQNVRSFFRSRSAFDHRYRSRVLELKEMTVLNLYRINRSVVRFCEEHKDLSPPTVLPEDIDSGGENAETRQAAVAEGHETRARWQVSGGAERKKRAPPRRFGHRRRRKHPRRRMVTPEPEEPPEPAAGAPPGEVTKAKMSSEGEPSKAIAASGDELEESGAGPGSGTGDPAPIEISTDDTSVDVAYAGGGPVSQVVNGHPMACPPAPHSHTTDHTLNPPVPPPSCPCSSEDVERRGYIEMINTLDCCPKFGRSPFGPLCDAVKELDFAALGVVFRLVMSALQDEVHSRRRRRREAHQRTAAVGTHVSTAMHEEPHPRRDGKDDGVDASGTAPPGSIEAAGAEAPCSCAPPDFTEMTSHEFFEHAVFTAIRQVGREVAIMRNGESAV